MNAFLFPVQLASYGSSALTSMSFRYTAVRGDPDDFERNNFFLRQNMMQRTTELFIVVTMYNEDEVLFCRTLHGVMQNISHLCTRKNSRTWGPDSWKKVRNPLCLHLSILG
jgi:chitin synthase